MIYIKLAWRNLFRNKRRTFIAGIAIGIGLASLIFVDAMVIGMEKNMIHSATASYLSEGQIHRADYRQTQEVELTINQLDQVVDNLRQENIVEHFTVRIQSLAMITSTSNVQSINLVGINPDTEKEVSQIDDAIQEGTFFEEVDQRNLLIGAGLADILEVEMGDRIVVTMAQAGSGDLSQEMFRISGIFHFNIEEMDRALAFIRIDKAQEMLNLPEQAHEIAIQFIDTHYGRNNEMSFWDRYSQSGNEAVGWTILLPQMQAVLELTQFSTLMTGLILFGVVALGIINTLFMSIHERMFEFGVLRAVGTRPFSVARLIFFEAGSLAIVSIILGNILGLIITYIVSITGIDYTGIEFSGVTFRELLYPELNWFQFIKYPFWVFVFTVFTGIYPAIYAAKMSPAESLRKSI
jgi:ABC-type lipoprotein release transport system permease subunit